MTIEDVDSQFCWILKYRLTKKDCHLPVSSEAARSSEISLKAATKPFGLQFAF